MSEGPEWFAPKRYGYGAGPPIAWQGWALTIGFIAVAVALGVMFHKEPLRLVAQSAVPPPVHRALRAHHPRRLALAVGRRGLADRQVALLVDQPPLVEV